MVKKQLRFNPEYQNEEGKWISLKPTNIDLKDNTAYTFTISDVDKNTDLSYSQKLQIKLVVVLSKAD